MANGDEKPQAQLAGMFQAKRDPSAPTPFGRIFVPDAAWLARATPEPILEPELAVIDTHHHL